MFREIRLKKREMTKEDTIEVLKNGEFGTFSTICENGYPYGVAVNYVYFNDSIYFHCARNGHKLDNISANNKVSFLVVANESVIPDKFSTTYASAVVFGKASTVDNEEKKNALVEIIKKYSKGFIEEGMKYIEKDINLTTVVKIEIDHISGKASRL
ncbi:pyridoxamine 5'-phosphate oxidase family protein [Clostridioides sp. ZZV14-6154]|uniref:pyridoxamine 5'-phosphate oxidase family protein n=1 Tax=Clostridioides sp. ZZV14-6154 TaxID=2811495 RepID=UPI001D0F5148|nr:pyridoxamine 5'-phosphate oxidase family protein [Clostridioides sp. ZZV14-6154]